MATLEAVRFLLRIPVPWVFILAYLAGLGLQRLLPLPAWTRAATIVGVPLLALGITIASWCLLDFRRARTTTTPGETSNALVTHGPYRLSRNPMYVSLTLAYLGEAGILRQTWPVLVLPLVLAYLQWTVIPLEEARLREAFGARYEDYTSRVRRWI